MAKKLSIKWLSQPADKDYPAAESFLQLLFELKHAQTLVKKLRRASMSEFSAKDLLRASKTSIAQIQAYDWGAGVRSCTTTFNGPWGQIAILLG